MGRGLRGLRRLRDNVFLGRHGGRNGPRHPVDRLHEAFQPGAAEEDLALATVENAHEHGLLERQDRQHAVLDCPLRDEVHHADGPVLAQAVNPADPLVQYRGVPGQVHVHDRRGILQVQTDAAGVRRKEHATLRILFEPGDPVPSIPGVDPAVEERITHAGGFEPAHEEFVRAQPLAEDDRLVRGTLERFPQDGDQFIRLAAVVGFPVEQIRTVAAHPHVLQGNHQSTLVGLGQEAQPTPLGRDLRDDDPIFLVMLHLLLRHGHEVVLVEPFGQLREHLFFRPADQDRSQRLPDPVEVLVADSPAVLVHMLMFREEAKHGAQPEAVHELHNGMELLQAVLQGRPGQHDGVPGVQPLNALGPPGLPVLDPLGFVEDHDLGTPGANGVQVPVHYVIIDDLVERRVTVQIGPPGQCSLHDRRRTVAELLDLLLPLVLERSRADDQDPLDPGHLREDLAGGNRLDRLAESHVVSDQAAACSGGEESPLPLIRVQRDLE